MFFRFRISGMFVVDTLVCATLVCTLGAVDHPQFYRAPLFQGEAKRDTCDWTTHIDTRYAEGSTDESWNTNEVKTLLFDDHCAFDLRNLASNLECFDEKPLTKAYAEGPIPKMHADDGKLGFKGRFQIKELDITLQQNLTHGLYLQAYIPIRELKICDIDYCKAVTTEAQHDTLVNFVENELDAILDEHCIKPLKTPFCARSAADPMISLGWHGHYDVSDSIITAIRGYLQAGIIIPTGSRKDINRIFTLPLGYSKHWGFTARVNVHTTFWKSVVFGVNAGVTIFASQTYDQRMTTSTKQNGWIVLEKGKASTDLGTIWDGTVYAKVERLIGGFSAMIGYSYTQQEDTVVSVKEPCFLRTALKNGWITTKDDVANSNRLLKKWYQHTLHGYAQYDLRAHTKTIFAPLVRVAYHYPLLGRHAWNTDMLSGNANLTFNWRF